MDQSFIDKVIFHEFCDDGEWNTEVSKTQRDRWTDFIIDKLSRHSKWPLKLCHLTRYTEGAVHCSTTYEWNYLSTQECKDFSAFVCGNGFRASGTLDDGQGLLFIPVDNKAIPEEVKEC